MFTLADLSDPHLAPLPKPRLAELIGKRLTGYINWQRSRRLIHDFVVLAKIVADLRAQAPDHIAVTGDIANIALPAEFTRGRDWLRAVGKSTIQAMLSGAVFGYRGLVREILAQITAEQFPRKKVHVVATGGYARLIARGLPEIGVVHPNLTLEGLRIVGNLND